MEETASDTTEGCHAWGSCLPGTMHRRGSAAQPHTPWCEGWQEQELSPAVPVPIPASTGAPAGTTQPVWDHHAARGHVLVAPCEQKAPSTPAPILLLEALSN